MTKDYFWRVWILGWWAPFDLLKLTRVLKLWARFQRPRGLAAGIRLIVLFGKSLCAIRGAKLASLHSLHCNLNNFAMSRQALIRSNVGKNTKQHRVRIPHCVRSSYEGHSLSFHLTLTTTTGKKDNCWCNWANGNNEIARQSFDVINWRM